MLASFLKVIQALIAVGKLADFVSAQWGKYQAAQSQKKKDTIDEVNKQITVVLQKPATPDRDDELRALHIRLRKLQ